MVLAAAHQAILDEYEAQRDLYQQFTDAMREWVAELCADEGVLPAWVHSRAKEPESVVAKFSRYPAITELGEFPDLAGIRVTVFRPNEVEDVRRLIYREFEVVEQEYHGEEAVEAFGYRGVHLVVELDQRRQAHPDWAAFRDLRAEVQIHTVLQNAWSAISHDLDYKARKHVPVETRRTLYRLAAMLESCDELLDEFCEEAEGLRARYQEAIDSGDWSEIPLDAESLQLAWPGLAELAASVLGQSLTHRARELPEPADRERLLDLAELLELETLGAFHEAVSEAIRLGPVVRAVVASAPPGDFASPDIVIGVTLLLDRPPLHDDAHVWLGPELAEALRRVARERSRS